MTSPFQLVFDRLCDLIPTHMMQPGKNMQAVQLVHDWLSAGCDAELDILPAINEKWVSTPTGVKVTSAMYFDQAVRRAKEERVGSAEHKQQ